jgi:Exocyst complex component Sec10
LLCPVQIDNGHNVQKRILIKHLKRSIVSVTGGFQVIADLNAYHTFVTSLRQSNVIAYFTALKMVANVFIVETPKDLAGLVRDVSRYQGTLRTEDAYESVPAVPPFPSVFSLSLSTQPFPYRERFFLISKLTHAYAPPPRFC